MNLLIARTALTLAPAAALLAGGAAGHALTHPATITVTRTVRQPPKVVTVTKTRTVTRWRTRTVYRTSGAAPSWYGTYKDPESECIGNLIQDYISAASGGPAGDSGTVQASCPGVNLPN